jgi:hypothetical protein
MFFEAPKADRLRPGKNSDDAKTGLDTKSGAEDPRPMATIVQIAQREPLSCYLSLNPVEISSRDLSKRRL